MKKTRTQIEVTINVSFASGFNAERFVEKMDNIKAITPSYKWDMVYMEDVAAVTFNVTTYEEYMAITSKSGLMGGSVRSEINMQPIYDSIDNDITKRLNTRGRTKKKVEDALADAA